MTDGRRAWIVGQRHVDLVRVEVPAPGPGEVLVRSSHAGVCGSDLHTWHDGHPWLPYPICPGHEATGWVEAVGDGVSGFASGDAVVLRPIVSCGSCFMCLRSQTNLCEHLRAIGAHEPGGMSDYFVAPPSSLSLLPTGMTMSAGAMVEPLSCVVHATRLVGGVQDKTVAVIGAGSIGLLAMLNALASGAARVVVSDTIAAKRDLAVSLGAHAALDAAHAFVADAISDELGGRPDIVLDCVGSPSSVRFAVERAAPGGRVAVIGVCSGTAELPTTLLQDREVMVAGSAMYLPDDFDRALDLVASGLAVERLVTRSVDLDDVREGFEAAASGAEAKVHVVAHAS
ncbi:MAG: zinc-binding dehydrogenase [Ilumatobacteraceae bacterium]